MAFLPRGQGLKKTIHWCKLLMCHTYMYISCIKVWVRYGEANSLWQCLKLPHIEVLSSMVFDNFYLQTIEF